MSLQKVTQNIEQKRRISFVRFLLLAAIGCVLVAKVYFMLYVVDLTIGIYSFLTSFVLFNILFLAYFRYKDPYLEAQDVDLTKNAPLVSIVVAVKNEEDNIRNCIHSCLVQTYKNKEIFVVNDGSTDKTGQILDQMHRESDSKNFHILHLSKSVGKKQAIEAASEIAHGEIYAFMDSDCDMECTAVEKAVKVFCHDRKLGALTSHGRVRGAHEGNIFQKFQDVYIDGSCRAVKGAESTFGSVTCCSGSLSFYKRAAVQDFIHEWAHDQFLGMEFKFCTDRRMTAHVLGTPVEPQADKTEKTYSSILAIGSDELENMRTSSDPDLSLSKSAKSCWNVKYSYSIRVNVGVPTTISALVKQQIRWKKSFIRSLFSTGSIYWKRPFLSALLYYIQTSMRFVRPYIVFYSIVMLPLKGDIISLIYWISGIMFTGMIYAVDFRLRNPGDKLWSYRPLFTFLTTFVYTWLLIYSAITIRNKSWR
ncbi:MAG: glycosyltransferase [Nitrososphaeraceae archaeon]